MSENSGYLNLLATIIFVFVFFMVALTMGTPSAEKAKYEIRQANESGNIYVDSYTMNGNVLTAEGYYRGSIFLPEYYEGIIEITGDYQVRER